MAQTLLAGCKFWQQPESFSGNQKCSDRAGPGEGGQAGTFGLASRLNSCQGSLCALPDEKRHGTPPAKVVQNQASANRKTKLPRAKAAAKSKAAKRVAARPAPEPPHIKRSIYVVLNVLSELMWSPAATYLDVCLELFLRRVANALEELRFCEYSIQTYYHRHGVYYRAICARAARDLEARVVGWSRRSASWFSEFVTAC